MQIPKVSIQNLKKNNCLVNREVKTEKWEKGRENIYIHIDNR